MTLRLPCETALQPLPCLFCFVLSLTEVPTYVSVPSDFSPTRSNGVKSHCCPTRNVNFFFNDVLNIWNVLPSHVVQSPF